MPNYLAQRGPYAKFGQDYSEVADLIATEASPGDCLNVDTTAPSAVVEGLKGGRPESFAKLRDLGQDRSGLDRELLFESRVPVTAWADKLRTCSVLWTVTERDRRLPAHARGQRLAPGSQLEPLVAYQVPTGLGFQVVERWQFNLTQVVKSVQPTI